MTASTSPIDALHHWFDEQKAPMARVGINLEYVENANEASKSARIEFDSDALFGRATLWENGLCDLEILSVETGEQVLYQHHEEVNGARLQSLLDALTGRMRSSM